MLLSRRFFPHASFSSRLCHSPGITGRCSQLHCKGSSLSSSSSSSSLAVRAFYTTHAVQASTSRPSDQFRSKPRKSLKSAAGSPNKGKGEIELFDAIVHEGMPVFKIRKRVGEACVQLDGSPADLKLDEDLMGRLQQCYETSNAIGAFKVLERIRDEGLAPTAGAFLRVIETCADSAELDLAENVLEHFEPTHGMYEDPGAVRCAAKSLIARSYLGNGQPKGALQVLGYVENPRQSLSLRIDAMNLGRDDLAWGCLIRALTAARMADQAVCVGREAIQRGVLMSDSLIFFLLEALRSLSRWQEADTFFQSSLHNGNVPHERTVGSLLRTLTAPSTRMFVDPERIIELTQLPENPSSRFRVVSLIALASVGELREAQKIFDILEKDAHPDPPDERAFSILIGSYANYIERGVPEYTRDGEIRDWYRQCASSLDEQWEKYMTLYGKVPPRKQGKDARSVAFQRYLWSKSRCMCCDEAVSALENALQDRSIKKWLNVRQGHFAAVLAGIETACDTVVLERVLDLMEMEGVSHDHRTLAFCIGTMLGQGDTAGAVRLVQQNLPSLVTAHALESQKEYRVKLLVRRLEMLLHSIRDSGAAKESEQEVARGCRRLQAHLKFSSKKGGNWR